MARYRTTRPAGRIGGGQSDTVRPGTGTVVTAGNLPSWILMADATPAGSVEEAASDDLTVLWSDLPTPPLHAR